MNPPESPSQSLNAGVTPSSSRFRVLPIDASVMQHVSPAYWDWRTLFDHDSSANPLQHADYVITELATFNVRSHVQPVLLRAGTDAECQSLAVLVPKVIRTSQVGGIGPGWKMHGLRLAGGRFLSADESVENQTSLLAAAARHCTTVGAAFLLIEDLDVRSTLHAATLDRTAHGCHGFASREMQKRWRIELPPVEEDYWKTFSSRTRRAFRSKLKKLGATRLERVTTLEQVPDFLRSAHAISQQSWQTRRFGLRIRDDEAELQTFSVLAQQGFLRSYLWWIGEKPAAFAICTQHRGYFRYEEIAYCAEFSRQSPGEIMLQQIVEDLYRHDPPLCFDFGGGDAEYKQRFGNHESQGLNLLLMPASWRSSFLLSYLHGCRRLRKTGREVVKSAGLWTKARQWLRYGGRAAHRDDGKTSVEAQNSVNDE
jgi:Acetyltransferase (GNAT) domain